MRQQLRTESAAPYRFVACHGRWLCKARRVFVPVTLERIMQFGERPSFQPPPPRLPPLPLQSRPFSERPPAQPPPPQPSPPSSATRPTRVPAPSPLPAAVAEQAAADGRRAKLAKPKDEAHAAKPTGEHGVPNQPRQDGAETAVAAVSTVGAAPPAVQASAAALSHKRWITAAKLVRISCCTSQPRAPHSLSCCAPRSAARACAWPSGCLVDASTCRFAFGSRTLNASSEWVVPVAVVGAPPLHGRICRAGGCGRDGAEGEGRTRRQSCAASCQAARAQARGRFSQDRALCDQGACVRERAA